MRILLVEDDDLLGDGLQVALSNEGHTVEWVEDGESADAALRAGAFDLVVLDLRLPKMSGLEVLRVLRGRGDATPVLILTAMDAIDDRVKGLDLGADDYLVKPFDMKEFFARVRSLERRAKGRASVALEVGPIALDPTAHAVSVSGQRIELSHKEFLVLRVLMEHAGQYLSRAQIEDRLYQWNNPVSSNAVEVHIHHLRKKLGVDLIKNVRGVGYIMEEA
ncbi:MAG: DNA-binding response regulator [Proteobacteria bacterium]|jgi:DNA-binding response OmpR family regulator|nr:MAG: DNA-binding response regulator [Pseudomonadota bacterium]